MTKHDAARRAFLVRAAVGAGAVAGAGLVPELDAQMEHKQAENPSASHQHPSGAEHGAFFNHDDAVTMRRSPSGSCPARRASRARRDAGVLNYIDLALAGAYADLQDFYRRGLAQLDAYCRKTYNTSFQQLSAAQQDEVITALEEGKATGFTWPTAQAFFNTVRTHTMEGMFADPIYGGNKDFAGWRLVGFPGAQAIFTPADMQSKQAFTRAPMIGLQAGLQPNAEGISHGNRKN